MRPVHSPAVREAIVSRRYGAGLLGDPDGGGLGGSHIWPFDPTRYRDSMIYRSKVWRSIKVGPPNQGQHYSPHYRREAYRLAVSLSRRYGLSGSAAGRGTRRQRKRTV